MMTDAHRIFEYVKTWREEKGFTGPLIVMGRSLGSASALELAASWSEHVDGLVIESGFAWAGPLLSLLGVNPQRIGFEEAKGFANIDKIRKYGKPTLIIHAEFDHIIPFGDGKALYEACAATQRTLLKIPGANHNDIFFRGLEAYMEAIATLAANLKESRSG
jgi:pimeloyl-ACP methyl ester carboxylesterase